LPNTNQQTHIRKISLNDLTIPLAMDSSNPQDPTRGSLIPKLSFHEDGSPKKRFSSLSNIKLLKSIQPHLPKMPKQKDNASSLSFLSKKERTASPEERNTDQSIK
jgi:hypothetical protein